MCTVSIVPQAAGCRIVCNRDERRTRPVASPPRAWPTGATYPQDPVSGGTWIGVNDHGLAVALLNRTTGDVGAGSALRSRGSIVPGLLACASLDQAIAAAHRLDRQAFEPFRLVIVHCVHRGHRSTVAVIVCDRAHICQEVFPLATPLMLTSSSLGDALVEPPRRRLFERLVLADDDWMRGQCRFHRHQWMARPDISVVMARADAATVSRTTIDMAAGAIAVGYEPLTGHRLTAPSAA